MTPDRPIPESVRAKAEAVYDRLGRGSTSDVQAIARALMDERERAAKIADEYARVLRKSYSNDCARAVEVVVGAIREG